MSSSLNKVVCGRLLTIRIHALFNVYTVQSSTDCIQGQQGPGSTANATLQAFGNATLYMLSNGCVQNRSRGGGGGKQVVLLTNQSSMVGVWDIRAVVWRISGLVG